ncbi:aminopeptidase [uncultured Desulfovibrio sp.]|uniref:aminopeptidase n=1 Tax=uncultured Desulfovibrio sp. TaxID=167968 RepID=UPI00260FB314|nr:aminopeptidase [uncultured Desulfovibrio sp.]
MKNDTPDIAYTPESAWKTYAATATRRKEMESFAKRYIDFLTSCKTERETIAYVQRRLSEKGYGENPKDGLFMRPFRGKALFAARRGRAPLSQGLRLIAAHADTPRLDFKQRPFIEQPGVTQAKTHYYGGIRKYQWLARPLALRGVITLEDGRTLSVAIGDRPGDPVFTIADLLPHLAQKQANQPLSEAFEAEKLNIILSHSPAPRAGRTAGKDDEKEPLKSYLLQLLHDKYGVREEDFISADMQAVPAGPAAFVGLDKALIGGYGQDDRICVFTALEALLNSRPGRNAPNMAVIFWDKEEIGSDGATGASSRFLQYCVEDIARAWSPSLPVSQVFMNTRALSADVTAAFDPDFPEVHEKQNAAQLGYGPCFSKVGGSRGKYGASEADAEFLGELRGLLNARKIPWQVAELGKVDLGGGGTVALFLAAYGMQVIDCGPALLSMHSPFELSSTVDLFATFEAYRAFLEG